MSRVRYRWRPLDKARQEIRVLNLDCGPGDAPLIGRLEHVSLDEPDKPHYETISYAWGDTALMENCLVDNEDIPIPASAAAALRCMRSPVETLILWIDCICIDQNNDHEKGHQVGLMADIFQNSCGTLAHLGDGDGNTAKRAFEDLTKVAEAWLESLNGEREPDGTYGKIPDRELQNWSSLRESIDFVAIQAIMKKPYFRRLWIVQEAALSAITVLCCNTWRMDLKLFVLATVWLVSNPSGFGIEIEQDQQLMVSAFFLQVVHIAQVPDKLSLSGILFMGSLLQCSKPQDRIFGYLGILRLSTEKCPLPMSLAPDYTKSVADVYCDATRYCIDECDELWLLDSFGYERSSGNAIEDLPTWVPSWYCGSEQVHMLNGAAQILRHAELWARESRATGTLLAPETGIAKVLSIRGVVLETISEHSDALLTSSATTYDVYIFEAYMLLYDDTTTESDDLGPRLDRLDNVLSAGIPGLELKRHWWTYLRLTAPSTGIGIDDLQSPITHSAESPTLEASRFGYPDRSGPGARDAMEEVMRSLKRATQFCIGRKAFLTQSGLLGIGPKALEDGDVIAVSKLSQGPMVLRRAEEAGPDHYSVIGSAFVEDIHSGEEIFAAADEVDGIGTMHLI